MLNITKNNFISSLFFKNHLIFFLLSKLNVKYYKALLIYEEDNIIFLSLYISSFSSFNSSLYFIINNLE